MGMGISTMESLSPAGRSTNVQNEQVINKNENYHINIKHVGRPIIITTGY